MIKIDFKKELKPFYHASARSVSEIDIPTLRFLIIVGNGDPNTSDAYAQAVKALRNLSQ